ncbi:MAG: hypothetical protein GY856_34075 [bacterium]|nr:hypothetical protein [bacterium]
MSDNPFRGHDFFFLGDDGELYRIKNKEMIKSKWEPATPEETSAHRYFMDLAENDGAVLTLRTGTTDMRTETAEGIAKGMSGDVGAVVTCLLLNFRSIRT